MRGDYSLPAYTLAAVSAAMSFGALLLAMVYHADTLPIVTGFMSASIAALGFIISNTRPSAHGVTLLSFGLAVVVAGVGVLNLLA